MATARYWRLVAVEAHGGADLELSALHLYDAAGRADSTATLTSTIALADGTLAALQDEDMATTCRFAADSLRASGFAIVWDFGVGSSADIIGPRLAGPALATFLASCTLQRSDDGLLWQWVADFGRFDWPGAVAYTNAPTAVDDPHWGKVSLLLHMDGADGSATFTDSSPTPKTVTANGNARISTAQSKFGAASAYFDGSGAYLSIPYTADIDLLAGGGSFTLECWVKAYSFRGNGSRILSISGGSRDWSASGIHVIVQERQGRLDVQVARGVSPTALLTTEAIPLNAWVHIAAGYNSASGAIFGAVNGVYQQAVGGAPVRPSANPRLEIATLPGEAGDSQYAWYGYIDEVRITKGAARYTANFTPPTAPFPDALGTGGPVFLPPPLRSVPDVPPILLSGGSAGDTIPVLPPATIHLDRQDANGTEAQTSTTRYRIPGPRWVKEKTASTNVPLRRRVQLYNQRDSRLVREVWSDPVTGEYSFDNIRGDATYFVIAFDHTGHYRAVIADNLTPEPIP